MKLFYHRSNTLRNRLAAGFSVFCASENSSEIDSMRDRFPASRPEPDARCGQVSPGKSAYAVHRGDACHVWFCRSAKKTLTLHVLESHGEREVFACGDET